MNDVVKVAATGIVAAVCAIAIRKQVPELSALLAVCAGAIILLYCVGTFSAVKEFMDELTDLGGVSPGITAPVIKVTGIAIVTRISADFCRDAKENALAATVELAGGIIALLAVLPLMSFVLELVGELL